MRNQSTVKRRAFLLALISLCVLGGVVPAAVARQEAVQQQAPRYQYIWRHDKNFSDRTTDPAIRTALRAIAEAQTGDCIVVERAGRRYLITDPYILKHAEEAYAPVTALAGQMGGLGKQMGEIGGQMGGIGGKMGEFGKQMGGIGKEMQAAKEAGDDARMAQLKQQMRALRDQMKGLSTQMQPLGEQMKPLSAQIKPLAEKMRVAVPDAEAKMTRLLDTAFLRQMAVEQPAAEQK